MPTNFLATIRQNPINAALLERLPALGLPDCWLVAGCLFQTVWNLQSCRPPTENISDYDVFYYDPTDVSYEAEDRVIQRVAAACADLDARIEVKNQARVHLWYRQRFGHDYPALASARDGIDRFLVACTCVGIRCEADGAPEIYASYGLDDLHAGILRPNRLNDPASRFAAKAASYRARWPWLRVEGGEVVSDESHGSQIRDAAVEHWLRTEITASYDEHKANPGGTISAADMALELDARLSGWAAKKPEA